MNSEKRDDICRRFSEIDSANVADILDDMGFANQGLSHSLYPLPLRGVDPSEVKLLGFAYTIRGQMESYSLEEGDPQKLIACNAVGPNEISVWSGDGKGVAYFGELIAIGMKEAGCRGALVDGGVRDVDWLAHHGFPVFTRYKTPVQSRGRWKVKEWQVSVELPGATSQYVMVHPGDFILADSDGAIVIPAHMIETVLVKAEQLTEKEKAIRQYLSKGLTLSEAMTKYGHL